MWVKIRDQINKGNYVVGVYYQMESADEEFFKPLMLPGDFNHPDIYWKSDKAAAGSRGDPCRIQRITS